MRSNNEDSFLGLKFDAQGAHHLGRLGEATTSHEDFVFAVSDGMGGARAGEFASRVTVEKIMRRLPPAYRQGAVGIEAGFDDVLTELFHDVHRALLLLGGSYEECQGMGATLTLCWFTPGWMYFAHIGDSRLYYLPAAGGLKQLTHDDTHVGWLYRNAKISEREARQHPGKNSLQRALGAGHQFVDPQLGAVGYEPGDRFLLCSDGLVDGLFDAQIERLLAEESALKSELRNP
ncbi:MAG TPA: protein phosphatase 2C domain-containing protein, partial [Chthoniobacterales bacterium]|nr:protein phosphatase 2C domain-containing protein [Chthoniobacterales bacterium]